MNTTAAEHSQQTALPSLSTRLVTAAALGIAFHHLLFRKGEWHMQAPLLFALWALSPPALLVTEILMSSADSYDWSTLARNAVMTTACFTTAVWSSMAAYRLFFHDLSAFPGPCGSSNRG